MDQKDKTLSENTMDQKEELAQGFARIYEKEWKDARQSLRKHKNDEEIVYLLMRIVRAAYDYCLDDGHSHKTKDAVKDFVHHHLPKGLHKDHVTPEVRVFIRKSMDYLLQMCSANMAIAWVPKGDVVDRESYCVEGSADQHVCDWTVWPAVLDSDGAVLHKGLILPIA